MGSMKLVTRLVRAAWLLGLAAVPAAAGPPLADAWPGPDAATATASTPQLMAAAPHSSHPRRSAACLIVSSLPGGRAESRPGRTASMARSSRPHPRPRPTWTRVGAP